MLTYFLLQSDEDDEEEVVQLKPSDDADVVFLFTKPTGTTGNILHFSFICYVNKY